MESMNNVEWRVKSCLTTQPEATHPHTPAARICLRLTRAQGGEGKNAFPDSRDDSEGKRSGGNLPPRLKQLQL
jgi:hypothetical protein